MSHITRRVRQAGVYFVSSRTWQSRALFRKPEVAALLVEQLLDCRSRGFYRLHAFVVMPDHFHALLTPAATVSLETAMQMIKGGSSRTIKVAMNYNSPVWQKGFHDRWIRDRGEYKARLDYINQNPVVARLSTKLEDYLFSSASGKHEMDASQYGETV
ncbi:MAG: transposase [Candidatus Acidiferrales bacterium]